MTCTLWKVYIIPWCSLDCSECTCHSARYLIIPWCSLDCSECTCHFTWYLIIAWCSLDCSECTRHSARTLWKVYRTPRNNQIPSKITCTLWKSTEHQWIIKYQVKWHVLSEQSCSECTCHFAWYWIIPWCSLDCSECTCHFAWYTLNSL
jgi:hypothetical protein